MKRASSFLYIIMVLFSLSCTKDDADDQSDIDAPSGGSVAIDESVHTSGTAEGMNGTGYDEDDLLENSTFSKSVTITFGQTVQVENAYVNDGVMVTVDGQDVEVNATASEVAYVLTGTATDGGFKIYSEKKFKLTLNNVSLTKADGPAINSQSGKSAFVVLSGTNSLTDGATYAAAPNDEDQKGTLFSEGQLIFSGDGILSVQGNNNHAIVSDDYIRVHSGTITVTGAVKDGIHCNDYFIADGGTFNIKADSDGIEAEEGHIIINSGDFTIDVVDDGIAASYEDGDPDIDPYLIINGGTFAINTTEGEGIESKSKLTIHNADITINSADDCINATEAIYINGGTMYCRSTGNDAMDSNGTFTIAGGTVIAIGSNNEDGIDCDGNELKITGGLVFGSGRATSAPTANSSTAYSLIAGGVNSNQIIHIEDADGHEVFTFMNPTSFSTMLFASAKLKANTTYNIYVGGSVADGTNVHGLYTKGTYTRGTAAAQFTTSSKVTQIGGQVMRM